MKSAEPEAETMNRWIEIWENANVMISMGDEPREMFCKSCVQEYMMMERIYPQDKEGVYGYLELCSHGGFIPEQVVSGNCGECGKAVN